MGCTEVPNTCNRTSNNNEPKLDVLGFGWGFRYLETRLSRTKRSQNVGLRHRRIDDDISHLAFRLRPSFSNTQKFCQQARNPTHIRYQLQLLHHSSCRKHFILTLGGVYRTDTIISYDTTSVFLHIHS